MADMSKRRSKHVVSQPISSNNQPASKWITMDWLSPSLTLYYTQENPPQLRDQHCSRGLCCLPPFCRSISKISISPIFQATEVAPRAQPSPCTCVQMIWTKGKFGLSTAIARDKLPGKQNHRLKKKTESWLETVLLGPGVTSLHYIVLNATVMMVSKWGLTKPQIIFFYAALLCLEQTEHTAIYSEKYCFNH